MFLQVPGRIIPAEPPRPAPILAGTMAESEATETLMADAANAGLATQGAKILAMPKTAQAINNALVFIVVFLRFFSAIFSRHRRAIYHAYRNRASPDRMTFANKSGRVIWAEKGSDPLAAALSFNTTVGGEGSDPCGAAGMQKGPRPAGQGQGEVMYVGVRLLLPTRETLPALQDSRVGCSNDARRGPASQRPPVIPAKRPRLKRNSRKAAGLPGEIQVPPFLPPPCRGRLERDGGRAPIAHDAREKSSTAGLSPMALRVGVSLPRASSVTPTRHAIGLSPGGGREAPIAMAH